MNTITRVPRTLRTILSAAVSLALVALAPGLAPYQAAAQMMGAAARAGAAGPKLVLPSAAGAPAGVTRVAAGASLSAPLNSALPLGAAPAAASAQSAFAAPAAAFALPASAVMANAAAAPAASLAAAAPAAADGAPNVRAQLSVAGASLADAKDDGAKAGVIESLFTGARRFFRGDNVVDARASAGASAALAASEGPASAPAAIRLVGTGLSANDKFLSAAPAALEAVATDPSKPAADRQRAVAALAARAPGSSESLERVAAANPDGGAADYEVHRSALRALAENGVVKSLRPVSRAHADEILAGLTANKPQAAVFDYDDTLAPFREPVSAEVAAGFQATISQGVKLAVLTDRPDQSSNPKDVTIMQSLAGLSVAQKQGLTVGSNSGARLSVYSAAGEQIVAHEEGLRYSDAERKAITEASAATAEKFGRYDYNGKEENLGDFKWVRFLPLGMPAETVQEAARFMEAQLAARGVKLAVAGRQAADPKNPSYLAMSLLDKSVGIKTLRARFGTDGKPVDASKMLIVGDSYFGTRTVDSDMTKAAPGALTIAVGGSADPRLDNAFVWPSKGKDASVELLGAMGKPAPAKAESFGKALLAKVLKVIGWNAPLVKSPGADDPVNNKTLWGLILQRLPSMAAYMLVTIAFVNVAVPVVGWAGYGVLMSLSPMAGIAAAYVMGLAVKNMSARNAMSLNTVLRVASLSALPLFHLFGVVGIVPLIVGALAEGWLLSSIITTEGSFVRALFPAKQLGNINGALFMLFPGVQVVLGLLLHIGKYADLFSPYTIFAGAALVNLLVVLPIIWATIPNTKLDNGPAAPQAPKVPVLTRVKAFLQRYWKEASLLGASVGLFATLTWGLPFIAAFAAAHSFGGLAAVAAFLQAHPALSAPLPIAAALVNWIARTDSFKALRRGNTAEPTAEEKTLYQKRGDLAAEIAQLRGAGADNKSVSAKEDELAEVEATLKTYKTRQLRTIILMSLGTVMFYPLYLVAAPNIAGILAGAAGKGELIGQFLGALFMGNMISTSARTKLPDLSFSVAGKKFSIGAHTIIQYGVIGLAGVVVSTLFPGAGLLMSLAAMASTYGLIKLTGRVTNRGWVKLTGVGFAGVLLPFTVWMWPALLPFLTVKSAMFLALISAGIVNGPNFVSLISYLMGNTQRSENSKVSGIQGSFFNAAISGGYALLTIASGFLNPAYPFVLGGMGLVNLLIGAYSWRSASRLPGLAPTILEPKTALAPAPAAKK